MANNYLEFSEIIENLTDQEIAWWEAETARVNDIIEHLNEPDFDDENVDPMICQDFTLEVDNRLVWFHSDESGNIESVADVVHRFLKECGSPYAFSLSWASHCSKPRIGEFGGGIVFVTAEKIEWAPTDEWLRERIAEFDNREKQFPRINLSFQGWCRNVEVTHAHNLTTTDGEEAKISLAGVSGEELARKVRDEEWAISVVDCLGQSTKEEIEIFDVEAS